jgi:integrase
VESTRQPVGAAQPAHPAPHTPAQIDGFLALAAAQPALARRMRAAGLVCLAAGAAGLTRSDLRAVRGTDIIAGSGGVVVQVRGSRPRVVPVLARYHQQLLAAAGLAGPPWSLGDGPAAA